MLAKKCRTLIPHPLVSAACDMLDLKLQDWTHYRSKRTQCQEATAQQLWIPHSAVWACPVEVLRLTFQNHRRWVAAVPKAGSESGWHLHCSVKWCRQRNWLNLMTWLPCKLNKSPKSPPSFIIMNIEINVPQTISVSTFGSVIIEIWLCWWPIDRPTTDYLILHKTLFSFKFGQILIYKAARCSFDCGKKLIHFKLLLTHLSHAYMRGIQVKVERREKTIFLTNIFFLRLSL